MKKKSGFTYVSPTSTYQETPNVVLVESKSRRWNLEIRDAKGRPLAWGSPDDGTKSRALAEAKEILRVLKSPLKLIGVEARD